MLIYIDKGHSENGNPDPGAVGNNLRECDITGQLGEIVKQKLSGYDCEVKLAPRGTLDERCAEANNAKADYFLSIHVNAGGGTGYETHIYTTPSEQSAKIGTAIHNVMAAFYSQAGFKDRGLKRSNFAVLRETNMPAALLENLFIDNANDAQFLAANLAAIGNEIAYALVVGLGLKELQPEVAKCDCGTCSKVLALDMEIRRLKQVIKQAGATLAPEMV